MDAQKNYQLKLPEAELTRLAAKIVTDYRAAIGDHNLRIARWTEYYRRWRAMPDGAELGDAYASNFNVPLIRWEALAEWAKEMDSIFGDDAEIVAVPVGESDYRKDKKISRYMTWRVFNSMKLTRPFMKFVLRKILFGKSHAYSPWKRDVFEIQGEEVEDFAGPGFDPLWPDDFIVPAEDVESLHDFSFCIRRYRVTPDQLLDGEERGIYQGISDNFEEIVQFARNGLRREFEGEEIKQEADDAEGVLYQRPLSAGESLMVIEWYGKWRPLKKKDDNADEYDLSSRERRQADWVVRFLWDMNKVIGVQDLADLYPLARQRRPFVEASFLDEGRYWPMGLCELLVDLEQELSANHNQGTESAERSGSPIGFYRPASGLEPKTLKLQPGDLVPVDNPETDVKFVEIPFAAEAFEWKEQSILSYKERLMGTSESSLGRASDRPNAPRTAKQTIALLEEGNVRLSLNTKMLAEDMSIILAHFWELDYQFAPDKLFFRVTEEDADGLFAVDNLKGGTFMTAEERDGRYDFRLKFADSVYSREADKEKTLARYQIDIQNPLIVNNPVALWKVTNDVHKALGDPGFSQIVPQPPDGDFPIDPKEEWNRLLQGEEITVNPQDNDQLHYMRHVKDYKAAEADPEHDPDALRKLAVHIMQQVEQLQQKQIVQALAEQAVHAIGQLGAAGALPPGAQQALQSFPGMGMPPGNPEAQPAQAFPTPGGQS